MVKTLSEIFTESIHDSSFRMELLDNHQTALSTRKYELSDSDMQLLNDFMSGDVTVSPSVLLEAFSNVATGSTFPIPPSWQPKIPPLDITQ